MVQLYSAMNPEYTLDFSDVMVQLALTPFLISS